MPNRHNAHPLPCKEAKLGGNTLELCVTHNDGTHTLVYVECLLSCSGYESTYFRQRGARPCLHTLTNAVQYFSVTVSWQWKLAETRHASSPLMALSIMVQCTERQSQVKHRTSTSPNSRSVSTCTSAAYIPGENIARTTCPVATYRKCPSSRTSPQGGEEGGIRRSTRGAIWPVGTGNPPGW